MLLTGDMLEAERAAQIGLVNRVIPENELSEYTMGVARKIAAKSSMILETGKKAFYRQREMPLAGAYESSIELEDALYKHPAVAVAAVVAMPHEKWGETPCAFIELAEGRTASGAELEQHCRSHLAAYKIPRRFVFEAIPRTATGKVQKNELRKRVTAPEKTGEAACTGQSLQSE